MRGLLAPRCGRGFHSRGALMASQWGERPKLVKKELFCKQETPVRKASPAVLAYPLRELVMPHDGTCPRSPISSASRSSRRAFQLRRGSARSVPSVEACSD